MDGILNVNKPAGITSYAVVAIVKRLSGERRVGHAGTLDPAATGVLPVCLGKATRVIEFLFDATKTYRAQIELGLATDTCDASGAVLRREDPSGVTRQQVEAALASFRGEIQQTPPMFSAVRHRGQKLYHLARAGINVERKSRPAVVHRLELLEWRPPMVTVEVECGKGTYIRTLADDLGRLLGCGGSLNSLTRLRCGIFDIESAVAMPDLEEAMRRGYWRRLIYPADSVLVNWKAVVVSTETEGLIRKGRPLTLTANEGKSVKEDHCRAYSPEGLFLGVLRFNSEAGLWQPEKVFV